jgi:2-hydroxy-6-oxonona-2,4-dienedioate hydrolase
MTGPPRDSITRRCLRLAQISTAAPSASTNSPSITSVPPLRTLWSDVAGSRIHAVAVGEGRPVVLVHGFGVSGTYMLPLARALASSFSAIAPDLPGQGRSAPLPGRISIGGLAAALGAWVEANGLIRPAFVANSMGCQVVTQLAATRPERVGPMVLVGPTIDPARRGARHQLFGALRDAFHEPLSLIAIAARDEARVGLRTLLSTARVALDDPIEERLPLIEQTTVVVHGGEDRFVGREWSEDVAALLPRGRLVVVPGEPHAVHYTRPDLVAAIVEKLLVEEAEHARGEVVRHLQHRDVTAGKASDPRPRNQVLPLRRDADRHQAVAFSPDE